MADLFLKFPAENHEFHWCEGKLFGTIVGNVAKYPQDNEVFVGYRNLVEDDGRLFGSDGDGFSL